MPRTISAALQIEFDKPVTRIGYLLAFATSPALRLCDLGTVDWNPGDGTKVFAQYDFDVSGLGGEDGGPLDGRLSFQNLDNAIAATLLAAPVPTSVDVYQVAPSATTTADVKRVGRYSLGNIELDPTRLQVSLIAEKSSAAFSPRRRVDPLNGFSYAQPVGSKIAWENEVYIVGSDRG